MSLPHVRGGTACEVDTLGMNGQDGKRLTITIDEAASRLGICRNSAYEAAKRGELPTIRLGGRILVPVAALQAMLESAGKTARPSASKAGLTVRSRAR